MNSIFLSNKVAAVRALAVSAVSVALPLKRVKPLPRESWPDWAVDIANNREPRDAGLGDTVVHIIGDTRSDKFKKFFTEKIGVNCGCAERQRWLNMRFPYPDFLALQTQRANDKPEPATT